MQITQKEEDILKHIRKTYLLAKAASTMYEFIKHDVNSEVRKAALEAKAKNNYFIKLVDDSFRKRKVSENFISSEEEVSFEVLEKLYQETAKK
jgi:hypothetical protein